MVVVTHTEVGGVQEDVGELLVIDPPLPKGPHHLVEARQMRLTSDSLIPLPMPRAATSSSTERVEIPPM